MVGDLEKTTRQEPPAAVLEIFVTEGTKLLSEGSNACDFGQKWMRSHKMLSLGLH